MRMVNMEEYLAKQAAGLGLCGLQFSKCGVKPEGIKVVMVSEVPPPSPNDGFYSPLPGAAYANSALGLFAAAGVQAGKEGMQVLLNKGIYITTAVKAPKTGYAVEAAAVKAHLPLLQAELALFPNLKVIMLMGDVAKKAFNMIAKAETGKNVIPLGATYKIRHQEYYWKGIRVFPSYIITGGNILIEKSKREMIAADIACMMEIIGQ